MRARQRGRLSPNSVKTWARLHAFDQILEQRALLVAIETLLESFDDVVLGVAEEPSGVRGRIADPVCRGRPHDFADSLNHGPRREVLTGAAGGFTGARDSAGRD